MNVKSKKTTLTTDEKYRFYEEAVQNVDHEVEFLSEKFDELRGRKPVSLREDFCGTGKLMHRWVQYHKSYLAYGVDLDSEPIEYGKKIHSPHLSSHELSRLQFIQENVLTANMSPVDIIGAFNFSYFIFKTRQQLKLYFSQALKGLNKDGVFFLDIFGGSEAQEIQEESSKYDDFTYYWDCDYFDAITQYCTYYIHFKPKGKKKCEKVFHYDWRLWSIAEIRELLIESGFSKTVVYWEGDDGDGNGNGVFEISESEENCLSWIAYIAAIR